MGTQCSALKGRSVRSSIAPRSGIKKHSRSRWGLCSEMELKTIISTLDLFQMLDCTGTSLYQELVPKEWLYAKKKSNCSPLKRLLKSLRDVQLLSSFFLFLFFHIDIQGCV